MSTNGSSFSFADPMDTELIVREYFHEQLKRKGFVWPINRVTGSLTVNCSANGTGNRNVNRLNANKRSKICDSLCSMSTKLLASFGPNLVEMCERLTLPSPATASMDNWSSVGYQSFKGVANELFAEGIKWGHILTLFVFSAELAFHNGVTKGQTALIDDIALWLCLYINDNVLRWINDHGGWESFILYASGDELDSGFDPKEPWSLQKFLLFGGSLGLFGAVTAAALLFYTKK